ncbi:MAG TPA: PP2C family protein-serine/threonine phosphatase, partial [Vicinamibacteria bacterium]|nr:PP2C family protein-serine/threonine phosphatase [Vicinamibacteria bacterium]
LLEESIEKRRLEEDMRVAAEIQRKLLPERPPVVPGYGVMGSNTPSRSVGGDYYDFGTHQAQLLFALGDVSGKGTGAALLMTVLRAAVRAHWQNESLGEAMGRINDTVAQNVTAGKYVTFFLGRIDPGSGEVRYVNAGHNPPVIVRADGSHEPLTEGGMVLGMFEGIPYTEGASRLLPGDALVVFSDGVTETWNPQDEEFGEDKLLEAMHRGRDMDADALHASILLALENFAAGRKPADDRTMIVIKRDKT